jgi:hypothetical protein
MGRRPLAGVMAGPAGSGAGSSLRLSRSSAAAAWVFALAAALLLAALAGGCGGADEATEAPAGRPPGPDEVRLVVSRDFGAEVLRDTVAPAEEDLDVLRLLAENADVKAGYGGRFVEGIDGLESSFGAGSTDDAADWFYWIDGQMADVGAGDWKLKGGETVWWDYHRWSDAMLVPQALHAFPRPYTEGALALTADTKVDGLAEWADANGLSLEAPRDLAGDRPRGGLVVATAAEAAATPWLAELLTPARSGLQMAEVEGGTLTLVAPGGAAGPQAAAVALAAPNQDDGLRPFLLLLGASRGDLEELLSSLTPEALNARVGVALVEGDLAVLPWTTP